jgi:general secretion pathway protein E
VGVFELLTITDALRSLMQPAPDILRINIQSTADGLKPLLVDGLLKVAEKMTTMHEIAQLMS